MSSLAPPTPSSLAPRALRALAIAVAAAPVRAADRLRLLWLRALGPLARPLVRDRDLRVALGGSLLVLASLAGAVLLPMWLLALGPIVWGVPHALSDVRYLVARPGLHRRPALWIAVALPLLALAVTSEPVFGFIAAIGAALAARGPLLRRLAVAAPLAVLAGLAHRDAFLTAVVFAHAHNLIAVALFASWRRRRGKAFLVPIALFALGCALILLGAFDAPVRALGALFPAPGGMDVYYHLGTLAPGIEGPLAVRLVLCFAFAQSVHYVVWVRLVPDEDRPRETPRTFAASLRALREDLGAPLLAGAILAMLGLAVWAAVDLLEARAGYLRAVLFHGHLEVAVAALLVVEAARPRARA